MNYNYLQDKKFLKELDLYRNKHTWIKIELLDLQTERVIDTIEANVTAGNISINGNSSIRRIATLTLLVNDIFLQDKIETIFSLNNKIRIIQGVENKINPNYPEEIWIPLGVYGIRQSSISIQLESVVINLTCEDKMCFLNGTCGGSFPTSVTFDSYDQIVGYAAFEARPADPNDYTVYNIDGVYQTWTEQGGWEVGTEENLSPLIGSVVSRKNKIYDIIQTMIVNYGNENIDRIFINGIPLESMQICRYEGEDPLYYNPETGIYTLYSEYVDNASTWRIFSFGDEIGYIYTDFIYPNDLISNIGENICSVLDKIKNLLGNFEYFYDVYGNFHFQEKKNYLNNSYDAVTKTRLDNNSKQIVEADYNNLTIIDINNYQVDFSNNTSIVYEFSDDDNITSSFGFNPNFSEVKNDYHIWGKNADSAPIHYHLVLKNKPELTQDNVGYRVVYLKDENGKYNGKIRLAQPEEIEAVSFFPDDWRAEMYLQGLTILQTQRRPDIYTQEILDWLDTIYEFGYYQENNQGQINWVTKGRFKVDILHNANDLKYFIDFLTPSEKLQKYSVDKIGTKIYSMQNDKINRLYNVDIPQRLLININMDTNQRNKIEQRAQIEGYTFSNIENVIFSKLSFYTVGYSAEEYLREALYQNTDFNDSISIQTIPIYYLEPNTRISVKNDKLKIDGDYLVNSISFSLGGNTMSISASKILTRI